MGRSRKRKPSVTGADPAALHEQIAAVMEESRLTRGMTEVQYFELLHREDPDLLLPPMADGCYMTPAEYRGLMAWARVARELDPTLQRVADAQSWASAVSSAYVAVDSEFREQGDCYPTPSVFSDLVMQRALARVEAALNAIIHYIPCYLFDDPKPHGFRIGPVEFIPGAELPVRIAAEHGRRLDCEEGDATLDKAVGAQADDRLDWSADTVGKMAKSPWIAVVEMEGYEPAMSRRRADDAARLAIASLGVLLHPSTAAKMGLVNEWGPPFVRRTLAQVRGHDVFCGSRNDPPQVQLTTGIKELIQDHGDYLDFCGALIGECLSRSSAGGVLRECWLNALYWYYTGCLESSDARAVICFATAFESLADGDGVEAIVESLGAILGRGRQTIINPSLGWSLEQTIEQLYGPARSEVVHGGRFVIFREYHRVRGLAAELCRLTLWKAHLRLMDYEMVTRRRPAGDNKATFLRWLKARTSA